MGKRSNFERVERNFYPTPERAVWPLFPHLLPNTRFAEPCCGDGSLARHLVRCGHRIYWASDIEYRGFEEWPHTADALSLTNPLMKSDCIITNPPWDRDLLHPMIKHFKSLAPTWLLFDADWMHTKQSSEFMPYCHKIVSVGHVKWIPDSKTQRKDNCAWYLFDKEKGYTVFIGR